MIVDSGSALCEDKFLKAGMSFPGLPNYTLGDFWSWAYSDLLVNTNRSVFAEFLVGTALGALKKPRVEWDGYDLSYQGKKIEVKASGYLQSWQQKRLSNIIFDIAPHRAWDAVTNTSLVDAARTADCYVFCLFADRERATCQVADVSRWRFYAASTMALNERFGPQQTACLRSIECVAEAVRHDQIKTQVDRVLGSGRLATESPFLVQSPISLPES